MDLFILEPISQPLAAGIVKDVAKANGQPIDVHIMSMGGDMLAGNAIYSALVNSPSKVTTKVIGVAASMASVISQAGDTRLISPDASFNVHHGSAGTPGRGTRQDHQEAIETLEKLDKLMIKSFKKTGLSDNELDTILQSDKLFTADEAITLGFFDGYAEPVAAVANFNKQTKEMSKISELLAKVDTAAIKMGLRQTDDEAKKALVAALELELKGQVDEQMIETIDPAVPATETGADILTSEMVSREEFELFKAEVLALIKPLLGAVEELPTPEETEVLVEETTTAKLDNLLRAIKSKTTAPTGKQSFGTLTEAHKEDWSVYEARKQEIANKNKR